MSTSPAVVQASLRTLRPLAAGLAARGMDVESLLRDAGVEPALMRDPDARIPASVVHDLWSRAEQVSSDPNFGLRTALGIQPGSFDVLDYVCRNCATVEDGMQLYCRFTPLLHDAIEATVVKSPDALRLRHAFNDGTAPPRQYAEFIIASLVVIMRQATGHHVVPLRVAFIHSRPTDLSLHRELFQCPIDFGADSNGLSLRLWDARRPLVDAQPGLLAILEQHAEHLLEKYPRPDSFVAQVRGAMLAQLRTGSITVSSVATRLSTSERTLRRRLETQGTTYQQLLTELRTGLATRYMREENLSIDEVALLLGFSDRTSFIRAFRGWTGRSPAEFRRGLSADCA